MTPAVAALLFLLPAGAPLVAEQGCADPRIPVIDMAVPYCLSGEPGLYPGGANLPTGDHLAAGLQRTALIQPLDAGGVPSPSGLIGVLSIGLSNTNQEWSRFQRDRELAADYNGRVVLVDGAQGGWDAIEISSPDAVYWVIADGRLAAAGVSAEQVQVVWLLESIGGEDPGLTFPASSDYFQGLLETILGILRDRFPNLQIVYLSSRAYAGWGAEVRDRWAFETAFSIKGLIDDQILGSLEQRPWLAWGPYLWADGLNPRSDGLTWEQADFEQDGLHPSLSGEQKVADLLAGFFLGDALASTWFQAQPGPPRPLRESTGDAYVDAAEPDLPHGQGPDLMLTSGQEIYVKFDLTNVEFPIWRAFLSVLANAMQGLPDCTVHLANSSGWEEESLTWNNAPGHESVSLAEFSFFNTRGAALTIGVTGPVAEALARGQSTIAFTIGPAASTSGALIAREGGDGPRLLLLPNQSLVFFDGFESGDLSAWSFAVGFWPAEGLHGSNEGASPFSVGLAE